MLRTTKRVLKVPHSLRSNVETPRPIAGLNFPPPLPPQRHGNLNEDILKVNISLSLCQAKCNQDIYFC